MLEPRPIYELLDYTFIIPAYQRGYRWESEQVEALLNDLKQFVRLIKAKSINALAPHYYCLQPIAVVADDSNRRTYIVVDGQQRLTTLYLLMAFLRPNSDYCNESFFLLKMDAREIQQKFLDNELYRDVSDRTYIDNIDNFYIRRAYDTICKWFENQNTTLRQSFRELLMAKPDEDDDLTNLHNVRVIWYEIEGTKALNAFQRLNYGKIPLTSTELVKALLLQNQWNEISESFRRSASYRRALEWDAMERTLHNPFLWSMLSNQNDVELSHLNLILDFVADDLNSLIIAKVGPEKGFVRKSQELLDRDRDARDYFNYNVVEFVITHNIEDVVNPVETVWARIRTIFNLITNWYDDREWYHLIGLLRILPKKRKVNREFVRELYELSVNEDGELRTRPEFTKALKRKIKEAIPNIPKDKTIESLNYIDDGDIIRAILKALNVKTSIDDTTEDCRFAFHLFDKYNLISLDHIHPQNISLDNISFSEYKEWFERRCDEIALLSDSDYTTAACVDIPENVYDAMSLEMRNERGQLLRNEVMEARDTISRIAVNAKSFNNPENREELHMATEKFDSVFGHITGIKEKELHSISNMALVDNPTNAALQNFMLDRKRKILMERHSRGMRGEKDGTYAMPATRKVYSKDYSREAPGDMRFWNKADRSNYIEAINDAYNYFKSID